MDYLKPHVGPSYLAYITLCFTGPYISTHARTHTHNGIPSTAGEEAPQKKRDSWDRTLPRGVATWKSKVSIIRVTQVTDHTYHQSSGRRQS